MSKKFHEPQLGRDVARLDNGALVVSRCFADIRAPYTDERVPDYLSLVDHSLSLGKKEYNELLQEVEEKFNKRVREQLKEAGKFLVFVLQGRDGAGKTGARVRIESALDNDAKIFQAICIGPPTEDERAHPHLWRFMTGERMPRFGEVRVFDRSWAERVLVEPVMKLAPKEAIERSYAELRAFEWLLEQQGGIIVKVWMDITKDEQEKRFKARAEEKPWKLSDSDSVAREHWDDYTLYANRMFHLTGTDFAPWYIISSEDKRYSRITLLQIANDAIKRAVREKGKSSK
jgi:polyphosphate kinase 2 (PPK2 family)